MTHWPDRHEFDVYAELLDRHIVDEDRCSVGKVDDVEFTLDAQGRWRLSALVTGTAALHDRLHGPLAGILRLLLRVLDGREAPRRIPVAEIVSVAADVTVTRQGAQDAASPSEQWWRDRVVARIPGSDRAG
jgi:hypothetical protein